MTYYVTALTNDKAQLIAKTMSCSCEITADIVAERWKDLGYIVVRREEG